MTRRSLIALPLALAAPPDTPRNRLCVAGNEFQAQYAVWAKGMNGQQQYLVDVAAVRAWEPLPGMWRKVEHLWHGWLTA